MEEKFEKYLELIGITTVPLKKRVDELIKYVTNLKLPKFDGIKDIFIEEYIKKNGEREYANLRLYSNKYRFKFRNFVNNVDVSFAKHQKNIFYINLKSNNYNFIKADENSRILVNSVLDNGSISKIRASKENCDIVMKILNKYYYPFLIE